MRLLADQRERERMQPLLNFPQSNEYQTILAIISGFDFALFIGVNCAVR
jgi:hypothetical protein